MRTIFLYIVLVGVILAALLEILRLGEGIKAPIDVSGKWIIKEEFVNALHENCSAVNFLNQKSNLNIEQSGKFLELTLNDSANTTMNGKLENNTMTFSGTQPVKNDSCGNQVNIQLTLKLIRQTGSPDEITGLWTTPNCGRCRQVSFAAVKENNNQ